MVVILKVIGSSKVSRVLRAMKFPSFTQTLEKSTSKKGWDSLQCHLIKPEIKNISKQRKTTPMTCIKHKLYYSNDPDTDSKIICLAVHGWNHLEHAH